VTYEKQSGRFLLTPEQAFALADPNGPDLPGLFAVASSTHRVEEKITAAFRTGQGVGWSEQPPLLFHGIERFFRPGYAANLVQSWIPALQGVEARLREGARAADVGCGHGVTTVIMAQAYPRSTFVGFDFHAPSITRAREAARQAGVADRVMFEVAAAKEYPGTDYDLVTFFDCLHDMGDPIGAGAHVRGTLHKDGVWMIVEPYAGDTLEENLTPVGRMYYSCSTMMCTPGALAQEVGLALGAQAGEARLCEVVTAAGFRQFRRATQTPFNLVFEAKL
jgi:SAM-dependent methyltransferase